MDIQHNVHYDLNDAVRWIARKFGLSGVEEDCPDENGLEDWKILANYSRIQDIQINIEVFVPLTQWIIKDSNLRPFAIMGEIQKSLCGKKINGLGKISGGDFSINFLTEEISCYEMIFSVVTYD